MSKLHKFIIGIYVLLGFIPGFYRGLVLFLGLPATWAVYVPDYVILDILFYVPYCLGILMALLCACALACLMIGVLVYLLFILKTWAVRAFIEPWENKGKVPFGGSLAGRDISNIEKFEK